MNNIDIRKAMGESRVFNYEVADALGIADTTLSKKLRKELPLEEKKKILEIIDHLARGRKGVI